MSRKIELPKEFYKENFLELYRNEISPQLRSRHLGFSHIQIGKTIQETFENKA